MLRRIVDTPLHFSPNFFLAVIFLNTFSLYSEVKGQGHRAQISEQDVPVIAVIYDVIFHGIKVHSLYVQL